MSDKGETGDCESETLCMAPWVHLNVTARGGIPACCEFDGEFANINEVSIEDVWNGAEMRAFRARLMQGERDERCWKCYDKEDAGGHSMRQNFNKHFARHIDWVKGTGVDGRTSEAKPIYWDVRFSNVCNFRCRSCWHGASSRWYGDGVATGVTAGDEAVIRGVEDADAFFGQVEEFFADVEEIYFAGGEPLLMDEHYRILRELDERGRHDVVLRYNTNFSKTEHGGTDVMGLWPRFSRVQVWASVDGTKERGELIRKGQSWRQFEENCRRIREVCPNVWFGTHTTVSVLNIFHLPELHRYLVEEGLVDMGHMEFELLQVPEHYNIRILPSEMKRDAMRLLRDHQDWIDTYVRENGLALDIAETGKSEMEKVIAFMTSADWVERVDDFAKVTGRLDEIRSEDVVRVLPELAPLLGYEPG
ncbi:MAG: twitch domain-containing radical SAM protein [Verrucomicrobiota bacterium]